MLVTFREHAAPDLCIFHMSVTIRAGCRCIVGSWDRDEVSGLFTVPYGHRRSLWYLKC